MCNVDCFHFHVVSVLFINWFSSHHCHHYYYCYDYYDYDYYLAFFGFFSGYLVPGPIFSCVSRAQPRMACCFGEEAVQWGPTVTSCRWGFRAVHLFLGKCNDSLWCLSYLKYVHKNTSPVSGQGEVFKSQDSLVLQPWGQEGFICVEPHTFEPSAPCLTDRNDSICFHTDSVITWAVAPLTSLSTAPLVMGSGTESKLWGKLKQNESISKS